MHNQIIAEIGSRLRDINIVSFSGGKDSTVVLRLVLAAMEQRPGSSLVVVTADTLMEIPYFMTYVDEVRTALSRYFLKNGIQASVVTVRPEPKDSFFTSVLGKGYPAAHMGFRWCTGKLKIDPIVRYTTGLTAGKTSMTFVGVRSAESALRAKIYRKKDYKANHYAPILDWSAEDVWTYLLTEPCPWGDHARLVEVYRYSSDECVYGEAQGVCIGNARYGCWACPLQKSTQLDMIALNTKDDRYRLLKHYKEVISGMAKKRAYRSQTRRNGAVGTGPFLVQVRKNLYADLKNLEHATGWTLITPEEEACILQHWAIDATIHNTADQNQPMLWDVHGRVKEEDSAWQ